jgi:hypothetical protein
MAITAPIDLAFRPKTYFWPLGLEKQLLTHIKGAECRAAIGRIHPTLMGGEYLPDMNDDEVEIARIEIRSTTSDVTSVYARRIETGIHYRVVDEYGGDTLSGHDERDSIEPLTLAELTEFFLDSWSLLDCLEMNFETDTDQMLAFFRVFSEFYPDLDRHLRQRVLEKFPLVADDESDN